ncbi:MAG TPA: MFS transporter [Candidatus Limnocylindria bacterium]|nr:MFS transporter [Candidatus Limnocylindria bacterium]
MLVTLIVSCALFMELLDGTVIATALPQIARSFGENAADIGVGISAYLVTLAVFIPISGWTADRIGSRTVFAAAIVVFTLASALCGMSGTLPEFTLARILQGIGGAMMVPVGRLVVFRSTEKRDLIRANALLTTPGLVALVVGPALGGLITTYASWRWIFFLNLPLGIAGLALVLLFMEDGRVELAPRFDPAGFVLSGVGLGLLMFGLDLVGRGDPNALRSAVLIVSGIAVAALSVRHARRVKHPLLDFSLLRIPTFASSVWGGTCVRLVIGTTPFLWGLLFQVGFAMSALGAGLLLLTCAIGDVGSRPFTTRAVRRFGFRAVLTRDALLLAAGILGCAFLSPRTPLVATVALLLFIGVVRSLAFTAINTLAYADVPSERMSAATSLASTLQQLSFGISVAFAAIVLHVAARIHHEQGGVYGIADFRIAFCAVAVIGLAAAYNFAKLAPDAGHVVSGHHGRGGRYAK